MAMQNRACGTCGGSGILLAPTIRDKIARSYMIAPRAATVLSPAELGELFDALGLTMPEAERILAEWQHADLCSCDGSPHLHHPAPAAAGSEGAEDGPGQV
jgi:hypothetical protein